MTKVENLPQELRSSGLFCCWRREQRGDKTTKVPYDPRTGCMAKSNSPATFAPLAVAAAAQSQYDGLGVGIFGSLCAIDIDHCIAPDGSYSDMAMDIMGTMDTYTEISPSGQGLRLLFTAPGFRYHTDKYYINNRQRGLEVYVAGITKKYVTVTGTAFTPGKPLADGTEALKAILERYMKRPQKEAAPTPPAPPAAPAAPATLDDMELLRRIEESRSGARFKALWSGDCTGFQSQSEADMALCNILAWWTNRDAAQVDRLFRRSGLMRRKWDRPQSGSTYGAVTVAEAIAKCSGGYSPGSRPEAAAPEKKSRIISAAAVPYEPPRWTLAPYFQQGKGTLIQGDPGSGKTAFMCAIAAHVSTGTPLLGLPVADPGDVLILSVEDDLPILRGRIEASGGDLGKCHFMSGAVGMTFNSPDVAEAIRTVNAKMVIFDPLQAFMGASVDLWRPNETRPALAKLFDMCDRSNCSCAIIAHMGKAGDKSPVNSSLGSVDIPAAMRSILQLTQSPEDPEEKVMVHVKCSNAPKGQSIAYTIGDRGGVHWTGFSPLTVEDLTTIKKRKEKGVPYDREPLVQVFNQLITDRPGGGFWSYAELMEAGAKILGFPPYSGIADLRQKLECGLAKELQQRDGIMVTTGHKSNGFRGVKIERYTVPDSYQISMQGR